MSKLSQLAASAVLLIGLGGASSALSADPPHGYGGMPARGFHGAPPSFHGGLPQGGGGFGGQHYAIGRPGHDLGTFRGHNFAHFTPEERGSWQQGAWRHASHNGYVGWWWVVGDDWFFYPAPIYPYPLYVGPNYYYDYYSYYPSPSYYWYHCEDPLGYFPNVRECNEPWEPVPPGY